MTTTVGLRPLDGDYADEDKLRSMKVDARTMDATRETFRQARRRKGVGTADRIWFQEPLGEWMRRLDGRSDDLDRSKMIRLCVGMGEVMSMRDAVLMAVLAKVEQERLLVLASEPHDPEVGRLVYDTLRAGFEDPDRRPDLERCQRGIDSLARMVCLVPAGYSVQPLTSLAYLLWWVGREEQSLACAVRALLLDDGCTMASIVAGAISRGVAPAWVRGGHRE
ncbi:hypothetical protein KIH77_01230 [Bifidobacterium sp. 82T24]|uniref:hypothetical protein n=1 Tax=Bifidobacterium pluvialisilvae TaxID=2834436 RepID=UPI001C5A2979|nr:hypothetical protein [Bifidobacterium pluvialisilvae]MBW3087369.1 hypothetical protein [Bifidobacterium pluvialisilvae]